MNRLTSLLTRLLEFRVFIYVSVAAIEKSELAKKTHIESGECRFNIGGCAKDKISSVFKFSTFL